MSVTRFIPCQNCRGKKGPKDQPGFYYNGTYVVECPCHKKWASTNLLKVRAQKAGISDFNLMSDYSPNTSYKGDKSRSEVSKIEAYARAYGIDDSLSGECLYFHGWPGAQKTTMAQWVGMEVLRKDMTVRYLRMGVLVPKLVQDFSNQNEQKAYVQGLLDVDLFILDNAFEKGQVPVAASGYQLPFLENFLRERIEDRRKGVIFVSTVKPDKIGVSGFPETMQEFVRKVTERRGTLLSFLDVYNDVNPNAIFKDKP